MNEQPLKLLFALPVEPFHASPQHIAQDFPNLRTTRWLGHALGTIRQEYGIGFSFAGPGAGHVAIKREDYERVREMSELYPEFT